VTVVTDPSQVAQAEWPLETMEGLSMNKSMLVGVVAGIGVATAGGVAGYQYFGPAGMPDQGSNLVIEESASGAQQQPAPAPVEVARATPAPAPRPAPAAAPKPAAPAAPAEECWDEEVTVQEEPKDQHAIAGTAIGAVVGGAIGKDVGDRDLTTAAGAAAGAFIGRRIQQEVQENRADERTVTTTERRCAPVGSR
jgi:uncharacterized protein YcfJ